MYDLIYGRKSTNWPCSIIFTILHNAIEHFGFMATTAPTSTFPPIERHRCNNQTNIRLFTVGIIYTKVKNWTLSTGSASSWWIVDLSWQFWSQSTPQDINSLGTDSGYVQKSHMRIWPPCSIKNVIRYRAGVSDSPSSDVALPLLVQQRSKTESPLFASLWRCCTKRGTLTYTFGKSDPPPAP
jgi:hypothetical protein